MYAPGSVAVPPGVVMATVAAPATPGGVIAVTVVEFNTTNAVASAPPTVTLVAPDRFVPVRVIAVPPPTGPAKGDREASVGLPNPAVLTTRKPILPDEFEGTVAVRNDARIAELELPQAPPRSVRDVPVFGPSGFVDGLDA
jgi:hypothetical protein